MNTTTLTNRHPVLLPLVIALGFSLVNAIGQKADTKAWNQSYHHQGTGVILPKSMAEFELVELSAFEGGNYQGNDVSIRFVDDLTKIDIYITKADSLKIDPENPLAAHTDGISRVISAIKTITERGLYHDLEVGDSASVSEFNGDGDDKLAMVEMVISYRQTDTGQTASDLGNVKRESSIAITFYKGYQIKVRHTFPIANDEAILKERRDKRDAFHSELRSLITEVSVRDEVRDAIAKLKKDPADKDSAGLLVGYAEASALVSLSISAEVLPFFGDDDFKASTELLAAFIAGNIEGQLNDGVFEDHPVTGALSMLAAYELLKKSGKCGPNEALEQMIKSRDAGTLDSEIRKKLAK